MIVYLLIRQLVKVFARWKEDFDNHLPARQAGGATGESYLLRNVYDSNEITIILGWGNLVKAKAFI